jgi:hypothetical protein
VYLEVKSSYTQYAFETYKEDMGIAQGFEVIWKRIADFKLKQTEEALFLAQCDNTPMIDEPSRNEGIKHLQPLLDLWEQGQRAGLIKSLSPYLLYAYTVNPLSFLMVMQQRGVFKLSETHIEEAFQSAWDSIKI